MKQMLLTVVMSLMLLGSAVLGAPPTSRPTPPPPPPPPQRPSPPPQQQPRQNNAPAPRPVQPQTNPARPNPQQGQGDRNRKSVVPPQTVVKPYGTFQTPGRNTGTPVPGTANVLPNRTKDALKGVVLPPTPRVKIVSFTGTRQEDHGTRSVDVNPTLQRAIKGQRLNYDRDGTTYRNEGRLIDESKPNGPRHEPFLPKRPPGYYTEWVVPTEGVAGPGPQRLVIGQQGEVWYSHDHYRSFQKMTK